MKFLQFNSHYSFILSFVLGGMFIGLLLTAQFKSAVTANSYVTDEIKAQKALFQNFDDDRNNLKEKITFLRSQIEKNQQALQSQMEVADLDLLEQAKKEVGLTSIKGKGLEIILGDGFVKNNDNNSIVHAADLRDLMNLLRTGKAEAIAINDQRILVSTSINSVGNTILVNNTHVSPPFKILVIGDSGLLLERIKDEKVYPDLYKRIQEKKLYFTLRELAQLTVPAYDGDFSLKYVQKN